jgi:heme exporter protein C
MAWKWFKHYTNPEVTFQLCQRLIPWCTLLTLLLIGIGSFWGLAIAPSDYQQGDGFRIIYIHVPTASLSLLIYAAMTITAFIGIVWQYKLCDWSLIAMAPVGFIFTFIALLTGSIWGKPMWGAWWVWDARLTSELILMFVYLSIIALYHAFDDKQVAGKAMSILTLVGSVNLPIIKFSVDWWSSLHQPATIKLTEKSTMASEMLYPLLINMAGFGLFFITIFLIRFRAEIMSRCGHRPWVQRLLQQHKGLV